MQTSFETTSIDQVEINVDSEFLRDVSHAELMLVGGGSVVINNG